MRIHLRISLAATASVALLLAACGAATSASTPEIGTTPDDAADAPEGEPEPDAELDTEPDIESDDADPGDADLDEVEPVVAEPEESEPAAAKDGGSSFDVRVDRSTIQIVTADGTVRHGFELPSTDVFHAYTVRPGSTANHLDVVAITLRGERSILHGLTVRRGDAVLTTFPEHLQPQHVVDAAPPSIDWTPDGRSIVWTEPSGAGAALRSVGWDDGPGTGRPADDNAAFLLDVAADVHVDGFDVTDGRWTLLLRSGAGGDPIEVRVERQGDGALALPN